VVEHVPDVVDQVLDRHLLGCRRAVGPPVATGVDRHHAEVAGQERHLALPRLRVDDGVRHDETHRDVTIAVDRVADAEAVPIEDPLDDRRRVHQTSSASIAAARSAPPLSTGR
jgi:hypothetical protein